MSLNRAVLAEFLSGALASVTAKVILFPLETIRVLLAVHDGKAVRKLNIIKSFNGMLVRIH
jgi:hypothetical protein